jgi:ubiquinone biosynthesis protein
MDIESMLGTVFQGMEPELDFTIEAQNMNDARILLSDYEHLAVPEVYHATERVLIQQMAPGASIRDVNRAEFSREQREAIGHDLLAMMLRGMVIDRMFHADPHPGNVFVAPGEPAYIIDWGMCGKIDRRMSLCFITVLLNLNRNDGEGVAKAWIEMGRATSRANVPAFINDMSSFVPTLQGASLETLDFGVALTSVLTYSSKRGIQTPPAISLMGKALANIEGSVRFLAPELEVMGVFEEEFQDIAFDLAREALSETTAAKLVIDGLQAATAGPEQLRSILRDVSNREVTMRVQQRSGSLLGDDPLLKLLALAAVVRLVRR